MVGVILLILTHGNILSTILSNSCLCLSELWNKFDNGAAEPGGNIHDNSEQGFGGVALKLEITGDPDEPLSENSFLPEIWNISQGQIGHEVDDEADERWVILFSFT